MVSYMHPRVGSNSQVVYNKYMKFDNCGTNAGYMKHYRLKDKPCDKCKEVNSLYFKSYYKNNKNKRAESYKKWASENNEKRKQNKRKSNNKRRAQKLNNIHESYNEFQVIEVYGTKCHICNEEIDLNASRRAGRGDWENGLHIDHLIPMSKDGPDTLENVRPSHGICNLQKANH